MCLRRAATAGCSAATQNRSVETTCLRRDRSSRYSATLTAEMEPNTATNCSSERFRKYIQPARDYCSSCYASHLDQVSENYQCQRFRRRYTGIAAAAAHLDLLDGIAVLFEATSISLSLGL